MDENTNTTTSSIDLGGDLKTQLQMRFQLLPEDLQKTIIDSNYTGTLFEIAKENKLTYEQLETLQLETMMSFLGMNKPADYREFLQDQFKKTDAEMDVLITAINDRVFTPVQDSLHKLYSVEEDTDNTEDIDDSVDVADAPAESIAPSPQVAVDPVSEKKYAPEPTFTPTPSVATPIAINKPVAAPSVASMPSPMQQFAADPVVPKPVPAPAPALTSTETNVLGNAGVVLGESQNRMGETALDESTLDRTALMDGIENPTPTVRPTIMANKLTMSTTLMQNKTTDYSLPKTSTPTTAPSTIPASVTPAQKSADPYRETV